MHRESQLVDELQQSYLKTLVSLDPDFDSSKLLEPVLIAKESSDRNQEGNLKPRAEFPRNDPSEINAEADSMSTVSDLASLDSGSVARQASTTVTTSNRMEEKPMQPKWVTAVRRVEAKSIESMIVRKSDDIAGSTIPSSLGHTGSSAPSTALSVDSLEKVEELNYNAEVKPTPTLHRMDGGTGALNLSKFPIDIGRLESLALRARESVNQLESNAISKDSLNSAGHDSEEPFGDQDATEFVGESKMNRTTTVFRDDPSLSTLDDPKRRSSIRLQSKALMANLIGDEESSSSNDDSKSCVSSNDQFKAGWIKERRGSKHSLAESKGGRAYSEESLDNIDDVGASTPALRGLRTEVLNFLGADDSMQLESSSTSPMVCAARGSIDDDDVLMGTTQLSFSQDVPEISNFSNEDSPKPEETSSPVKLPRSEWSLCLEWQLGKANDELVEIGRALEVRITPPSFDSTRESPVIVNIAPLLLNLIRIRWA